MDTWQQVFAVIGALVFGLLIGVALSFVFALPVMLLWNWLMPIFGLPTLTFMQSWGLMTLTSFLFKNHSWGSNND